MDYNFWTNLVHYGFKSDCVEKNFFFQNIGWTESGSLNPPTFKKK